MLRFLQRPRTYTPGLGRGPQRLAQKVFFTLFCTLGWVVVMACQVLAGHLAGADYVHRVNRVYLACNSGAVGDDKYRIFECAALARLRQQHEDLFTFCTDKMPSFFAQQDHLGVP